MMVGVGSPWLWAGFTAFVLVMLALDLGVFHRGQHVVKMREALAWVSVWVSLALVFAAGLFYWYGVDTGLQFVTGYLIEYALSVDNIFVFIVIFTYFAVPREYHHRVLFWGILGALVMRFLFILAGTALIERFHWVIYALGAFLVYAGVKVLRQKGEEVRPEKNPVLKIFRRFVPMVSDYRESRFVVRENGRLFATPLLLVLAMVEATDLVFAVDSIPAIFAVTRDPFIVFTSNIFAILGLRSLYFLLSGVMGKFQYLKVGLGLVLVFVGFKMLVSPWFHLPTAVSLGVVVSLLAGSVVASLLVKPAVEE